MDMAFVALGILLGGVVLAKEANTLGVMAVGKLLGATVGYGGTWERLPRARVIWEDGTTLPRALLLMIGGIAGGLVWIAMLLAGIYAVLRLKADGGYPLEMLGITLQFGRDALATWWDAFGAPFSLGFLSHVYERGLVMPYLMRLAMELDALPTASDVVLLVLREGLRLAAIYMAVTVIPLIAGLSSYTNIVRRLLLHYAGEGVVMIYMDLCILLATAIPFAVLFGEFLAFVIR